MKMIGFALLLLFYSSLCKNQFVKLGINETFVGNTDDFYYFKVEQENEFIQIRYHIKTSYYSYIKGYESDDENEIFKSPPTSEDNQKRNFKYYFYDGSEYSYFYLPKTENIKMICFGFFHSNLELSFKRGQLFLVQESQHLELNDVFLNAYYSNENTLLQTRDSFGYYSNDTNFKVMTGVSSDDSCSTVSSSLHIVSPNSNTDVVKMIILENIKTLVHLDIKKLPRELYTIYTWISKGVSLQVKKEYCNTTILALEYVEADRNVPSVIDYIRAYGDANMYLSRNVGRAFTFGEIIDAANESIYDNIITNKNYNLYVLKCTEDSYLSIFSNYASESEYDLKALSTIVTYLTKGKTLKYNILVKKLEDFDFNITILNKDINLKEGDLNISTNNRNIAITEKYIVFHHNAGETFLMFDNKNYDLMLKIDFGERPEYKYRYSDTQVNKEIADYTNYEIAYFLKKFEQISGYKKLEHFFHASTYDYYDSAISGLFLTQNNTKYNIIKDKSSSAAQLSLDNEILLNYNKKNPSNPLLAYFSFYSKNERLSYYVHATLNYYIIGQIILQKDKIWRSSDSIVFKRNFEFEPKEKNTTKAAFQIFKCRDSSNPNLRVTYNSQTIIQLDYQRDNLLSYDFDYNIEGAKASGVFEGDFLIYYHLYSTTRKKYTLNFLTASIELVNFNNNTIILTLQPYVEDEESDYKIY